MDFGDVSIPDRYAKNQYIKLPFNSIFWFQFLIGTLKTRLLLRKIKCRNRVSIPDRYAKNVRQAEKR